MIVFHGSLVKVEQPRILVPSHTLDYGAGFYTTTSYDYDVVYGPVANDKVYAAFALYEQGFIDKQALIREMRAYKFVDQLLFHTEKAVKTLIYIESKEVTI